MMMKPAFTKATSRHTGTARRQRMDAITADWVACEHFCPSTEFAARRKGGKVSLMTHGRFTHRIAPGVACHLPLVTECAACLEFPTPFGALMRRAAANVRP